MKSTLILAAALVASVAAAPSYNGGSSPAPGSNYDAAKPAPAPGSNYDAAKPAPVQPGYGGSNPAVTTPCSSAAAAKPTVPASGYDNAAPAPAPAPTGAYDGASPDAAKKPCTTAVADYVAAPSTTPCEKSAAKTTDAYEQAAPAQPTGAYDVKIQPAGQQQQPSTDGSLYQASSAGKVGGSVVALMVAGAGLLAF